MNAIIAGYSNRGVIKGGLILFPDIVAIEVVQALSNARLRVYGVDAFSLENGKTQPLQEHSIDLSSDAMPWTAAIDFLKQIEGKRLYFEIVTD